MMQKGRALGLNVLRCHIKVCDPDYLAAADEVGMLVWYEVPSWERWTAGVGGARQGDLRRHDEARLEPAVDRHPDADQRGLGHRHEAGRPAGGPAEVVRGGAAQAPAAGAAAGGQQPLLRELPPEDRHRRLPPVPTRSPTTPIAGTSGSPTSRRVRRGRSARTATPCARSRSRWSCPSSATGACRSCRPSCRGGSRATSTAAPSRARRACSIGSTALGFDRVFGDYPTLARETQWRQFYSLKHEIESMRRHALDSGATSSPSSPTSTGKSTA